MTSTTANLAVSQSRVGNCDTDFFSATVPGGKGKNKIKEFQYLYYISNSAPPLIRGSNPGQHMYIPASPDCNVLSRYQHDSKPNIMISK